MAINIDPLVGAVQCDAQLVGDIIIYPYVVVACKPVYFHPAIAQLGQLAQEAHIPAWHYMAILKPEVEYVAHQVDAAGISLDVVEPLNGASFALALVEVACSQMQVRYEIGFVA